MSDLKFKVGDRVRFVRETYKNRAHSLTEEVPFSTVGVVGNVDHDDALRPYCVSFSDLLFYWMAADEIEAAEPRLRFKIGDRAKVTARTSPHRSDALPHSFDLGTEVCVTSMGDYGFDYRAASTVDKNNQWFVMDADLSPIEPESDGTLSLLEAMQESERTGAEFVCVKGEFSPYELRYKSVDGTLRLHDTFISDTRIARLTARYRMCKTPLEELEERQAKELKDLMSKCSSDTSCHSGYVLAFRHAAERAELEGRK